MVRSPAPSAPRGVNFPAASTSASARRILADALRHVDPVEARDVEHDTNWRRQYIGHFRRLSEAGVGDPTAARRVALDGLAAMHDEFVVDGRPIREVWDADAPALDSRQIAGTGDREDELSLPLGGERLRGNALLERLGRWVDGGIITASCRDAVASVVANPEWLELSDLTFVVLGAGAEMGPYPSLARWGARVVAVDLPRDGVQERVADVATHGAGTTQIIAANILHDLPSIAATVRDLPGRLVVGNYCYADGATHVRVAVAGDALADHLLAHRPDTALAYLATPTDAFIVPRAEVERSAQNYAQTSAFVKVPLRAISGGRLLRRNYPPAADPGICDSLVSQQGPNYALAKRLQRWRATAARQSGHLVSLNVAPATRTRSVVKNKALAAAYAGAHRFGVEVFEPATSNVLMAALLVHDLRSGQPELTEPWMEEARGAAHGGLWTTPYSPRSALGLAALLGLGSTRP